MDKVKNGLDNGHNLKSLPMQNIDLFPLNLPLKQEVLFSISFSQRFFRNRFKKW